MATNESLPSTPVERILKPFQEFLHHETSSGIILLICTAIALIWANSPWNDVYHSIWGLKLTIGFDQFALSKSLWLWINDGLMAIFFFVVGLEIKRELLIGELASLRKAALPVFAAVGGMIVPATIYTLFNAGEVGAAGWGIPMATDIAFALGVLALLGQRIPLSIKIFLTALAIVDDLGAVMVIALFYTDTIAWSNLIVAAGVFFLLIGANRLGVLSIIVYMVLGIILWIAFLKSGIHATIAGVLLAVTIPSKAPVDSAQFITRCHTLLSDFERFDDHPTNVNDTQRGILQALEITCKQTEAPLQRMEHILHPWVSFLIMPIFALANAGVTLEGNLASSLTSPVGLGVIAGLVIGKQVGITAFVWLAVKAKLADLPTGITWRHIYGVSWLAGIGFTMSLFITGLAFQEPELIISAKFAILMASLIAGVVGWTILRVITKIPTK